MAMEMMEKIHQHEWKRKKRRWSKEEELSEETHMNGGRKERTDGDERAEKRRTGKIKRKRKRKVKKS